MKGDIMNILNIKNSFYWILTLVLLSGPAHDVFAQRTRAASGHRSSEKRITHKKVEKKKDVRRDLKKNVEKNIRHFVNKNIMKNVHRDRNKDLRKNPQRKDSGKNVSHRIHKNRTFNKGYKQSTLKNRFYNRKSFGRKHYRKPSWLDYHKRYHNYPRIGTHFSYLPRGYISFRIGSFRFFAYQGAYYRYDPTYRSYVVIEKPVIESTYTSTVWDRITLVDGSTIEGVYISGDMDKVVFEVGDALLEIPRSEIKVLAFAQE
jgi:hypothetical protein